MWEGFTQGSYKKGKSTLFYYHNNWSRNKESILFVHGFPDGPSVWTDVARNLVNEYNVIIPFLPGVHLNCDIEKKYTQTFHLNVLLLLKSNDYLSKGIHLVGHDVGGVLVDQISHLLGNKCMSVSFISTMGLDLYSKNLKLSQIIKSWYIPLFSTRPAQILLGNSNPFTKKFLRKIDPTVIEAHIPQKLKSIKLYREFVETLYYKTQMERINHNNVLFLFSNEDPFVEIPDQSLVHQYYPNAKIRVLEGGHWEFCQRPKKYSELLSNHFNLKNKHKNGESYEFIEA